MDVPDRRGEQERHPQKRAAGADPDRVVHADRRAMPFAVVALLIAGSRIFVGTHYVTDVLGGMVTGIVAAIAVRSLYRQGTRADRLLTSIF